MLSISVLVALLSVTLALRYVPRLFLNKLVNERGIDGLTSWTVSFSDQVGTKRRFASALLQAGEGADKMWDEAAERLVSGKGGEVFMKEGGLSALAAKAAALEAEEDALTKEAEDTTRNRPQQQGSFLHERRRGRGGSSVRRGGLTRSSRAPLLILKRMSSLEVHQRLQQVQQETIHLCPCHSWKHDYWNPGKVAGTVRELCSQA